MQVQLLLRRMATAAAATTAAAAAAAAAANGGCQIPSHDLRHQNEARWYWGKILITIINPKCGSLK